MTNGTELKPCPFCGGKAVIFKYFWSVRCEDCLVETSIFETKEEATEAWNRRVNDDA